MYRRWDEVERLIQIYKDLPFEAVFKEDLLRTGLGFTEDALKVAAGFKPKAYFIFSFDLVPIRKLTQEEHLRAPEEIRLRGGAPRISAYDRLGSPQPRLALSGRNLA